MSSEKNKSHNSTFIKNIDQIKLLQQLVIN
jgi:hypothetical protein